MRPVLYVVAKAPIMGRAKTRLAADIGPVHAKRIYRALMGQVLRQVVDRVFDAATGRFIFQERSNANHWDGLSASSCGGYCSGLSRATLA